LLDMPSQSDQTCSGSGPQKSMLHCVNTLRRGHTIGW
jgi:hypothetical protein